jgi:hypothetical protein
MNATITRSEVLIAQLDGHTRRIVEIAALEENRNAKDARARVIAESALVAIMAHSDDAALKAALDRLIQSFSLVQ